MFGDRAFRSWYLILAGAVVFGGLFSVAIYLGEALLEGLSPSPRVAVGLGTIAAIGFVGVTLLLRLERYQAGDLTRREAVRSPRTEQTSKSTSETLS